jgi:hypothetical protein
LKPSASFAPALAHADLTLSVNKKAYIARTDSRPRIPLAPPCKSRTMHLDIKTKLQIGDSINQNLDRSLLTRKVSREKAWA